VVVLDLDGDGLGGVLQTDMNALAADVQLTAAGDARLQLDRVVGEESS
jgi:hypothetical protein